VNTTTATQLDGLMCRFLILT